MAVYPLLITTAPQADPGLPHTTAINNVTDLQNMNIDKAGNYYLTGNIDASDTITWNAGAGFVPVGTSGTKFTGTFDGCGFTISDLFINRNTNGQGLFGFVGALAKIANVTLSNVNITGGGYWVGALAAYVQSSEVGDILIQNCHASGAIKSYGSGMGYYGGLIGQILRVGGDESGTVYVYDCDSSCDLDMVNASIYSTRGGFIGVAAYAVIKNCHATGSLINGNVADTGQDFGGFAGSFSNDVDISFCYATGDIPVGAGRFTGGFIGFASQTSYFNSCYATGDVNGRQEVGGFVGYLEGTYGNPTVTDCYAWGNAVSTAAGYAGGFCGVAEEPSISFINCYSIGSASGAAGIGGFCGVIGVNTTVTSCYWDKEASGNLTTSQNKGLGKITKWFRKKSHFTGWDFVNVWYMPDFGRQIVMGRPRSSYPVNCPHTSQRNVYA